MFLFVVFLDEVGCQLFCEKLAREAGRCLTQEAGGRWRLLVTEAVEMTAAVLEVLANTFEITENLAEKC